MGRTTGKSAVFTGEYPSSHADFAVVNIISILRQADCLVTQPLYAHKHRRARPPTINQKGASLGVGPGLGGPAIR